jgi:hypothetical protein
MGTDVGAGEIFPFNDRALKFFPFLVSTLKGEAAYLAAQLASLFVNTVRLISAYTDFPYMHELVDISCPRPGTRLSYKEKGWFESQIT